ncbi:hypothetical protein PMAYCL1PPCAC_04570, partial [Pristionchus mayeri]
GNSVDVLLGVELKPSIVGYLLQLGRDAAHLLRTVDRDLSERYALYLRRKPERPHRTPSPSASIDSRAPPVTSANQHWPASRMPGPACERPCHRSHTRPSSAC